VSVKENWSIFSKDMDKNIVSPFFDSRCILHLPVFSLCLMAAIQAASQVKVIHVGSTARFSCDTTDVKDIFWEFSSASYSSQSLTVYEYPDITPTFMSTHSVSQNNLSISKVQLCDAGNYRCSFPSGDDLGTDNFELIVLG